MQASNILQEQSYFTAKHTIVACGVVSLFLYIYLGFNSQSFAQASFSDYICVVFPCAILSFIAWYHLHVSQSNSPFKTKQLIFYIIGFAVLFRVVGFFIFPILEDDFYRYLWDAYILFEQGSPYISAPSAYFGVETVPENFQNILDNINYPDIATVYGPMCQWVFGLAYLIAPGELWPIKLLVLLADFLLLLVLVLLMKAYAIKAHYLLLFAWSPLVITQFVVSAHPDIISVMFVFIAFLAQQRKAFLLMALSLALATATKVFAIIFVPLLLGFYWKRWLVFLLVSVSVAWPLGLVDAWLPEGLKAMASQWYFNAPLYALLSNFDFAAVKVALLTVFSLIYLYGWRKAWWQKDNKILRGDIIFGLFLLVLPALNTWYLIFILPFGVFYPSRTLWTASLIIFLSYVFIDRQELVNLNWILAVEFGFLLLIFLFDLKAKLKN